MGRSITEANSSMRDRNTETNPDAGFQAAVEQLGEIGDGPFRADARIIVQRLQVIAQDGIDGLLPPDEQRDLRRAARSTSTSCTARGYPLDLLEPFSSD